MNTNSLAKEEFEQMLKLPETEPENGNTNREITDKKAYDAKDKKAKMDKVSSVTSVKVGSVSSNAKPTSKHYTCEVCSHRSTTKYGILMHSYLEHKGFLFVLFYPEYAKNHSNQKLE